MEVETQIEVDEEKMEMKEEEEPGAGKVGREEEDREESEGGDHVRHNVSCHHSKKSVYKTLPSIFVNISV